MTQRVLLVAWLLGLLACGDESRAASADGAAIVDGERTSGFESVVAIALQRTRCEDPPSVLCSGTVIAPRAVLSAAHCFLPMRPGLAYEVYSGDDAGLDEVGVPVLSVVTNPGFDEESRERDLALLWLARPIEGIAPEGLPQSRARAPQVGEAVDLVGFGATTPGVVPDGAKRVGSGRIGASTERVVVVDPAPAVSCVGDSGGPLFTMGDAAVFVGVASSGDPGCRDESVYALVAPSIDTFIEPTLEEGPPSEPIDADVCGLPIEGPHEGSASGGCGVSAGAAQGGAGGLFLVALVFIAARLTGASWR